MMEKRKILQKSNHYHCRQIIQDFMIRNNWKFQTKREIEQDAVKKLDKKVSEAQSEFAAVRNEWIQR